MICGGGLGPHSLIKPLEGLDTNWEVSHVDSQPCPYAQPPVKTPDTKVLVGLS